MYPGSTWMILWMEPLNATLGACDTNGEAEAGIDSMRHATTQNGQRLLSHSHSYTFKCSGLHDCVISYSHST